MRWFVPILGLSACGGAPCVDATTECDPLYDPTFDNVFDQTLRPTCGVDGASCHSASGAAAGLVFDEVDSAYSQLVDGGLVEAGEVGCSTLITRVDAEDNSDLMPPGSPLSEAERCAIRQWIETGAER